MGEIEQPKISRKYSRNKPEKMRKKSKSISNEEALLVNYAVDGILDILFIARYRRLLGLLRFYELGFLIHHKNASIRRHTLQSFWNKLRDHRLPSHYSCIFPLIATDPSRKIRDVYKPAVQKYFDRMRAEQKISGRDKDENSTKYISKLPEYLLFYVVHLLCHHPDFDEKLAKKELRDSEQGKYRKDNIKKKPFVGWRGRRKTDLDDSEYDTSPSRMLKKKKQENDENTEQKEGNEQEMNDKEEAEDDDDDKKENKKKQSSPDETSCIAYFGTIFEYFFDALLKGSNQFPLILKILNKIDDSYDVFKPLSKAHRYLIRIAMMRLQKKYKNNKFQDFPGRVPTPKAIFKLVDAAKYEQKEKKITIKSPRRIKKKYKEKEKEIKYKDKDSVLATTATEDNQSVIKQKNKMNEEEEGSDHPSDDDVINDKAANLDVSGLNLSAIRRNLNETITDDGSNDKKNDEKHKKILSGSSAEADDENNAVISAPKQKRRSRRNKNIGRKRKRAEISKDDKMESDDKEDKEQKQEEKNDENQPLKKRQRQHRRRGGKRK